jgi:beta-glucosidase
MSTFPKNFYWGAATASYQVEGGIDNCDWAEAARAGKVPTAGRVADHYNLYEQDFDIAKELGHNAHRFSLEWARIEPKEGVFDEEELEHYRNVLLALKKRGIEPFVTLWHFTLPQWLADKGGFDTNQIPELFARYAGKVVSSFGDLATYYSTINEPNVYATHGYLYGAWPPFKQLKIGWCRLGKEDGTSEKTGAVAQFSNLFTYRRVEKNLVDAHIAAYKTIKKNNSNAQVSVVKHVHFFDSDGRVFNRMKAAIASYFQTDKYISRVQKHSDVIGLNYYRSTRFGETRNYLRSDMDWKVLPSGIYGALLQLKKFNKPVFIAEAGIADENDSLRAQYITVQIQAVAEALAAGVDVRGHMYWSLMDNYEWALGTTRRFGLVEIDYCTLERTIRPSAWVYKDLIEKYSQ